MLWSEVMANRARFMEREGHRYYGMYVAWNADGTRIVASARREQDVHQLVTSAGLTWADVCYSYVEDPNDPVIPVYLDRPDEE